jgi:small subunit ribosomal protein S3
MGQKVHPGGMRVGVIHDWKSNWYTGTKEFPQYLIEDIKIREHIYGKLAHAGLSDILIRKDKQRVTVDIYTARPGIVIGKSGVEVDALRRELHDITKKNVHININEIKRPELDAKLVAQSIAEQLQNRVSFRRAMKRALASGMRSGAKGVRIQCGGRLGGTEMSRSESYSEGRVPLHTIRADIDYGFVEAKTTAGRIGVKVWINKGEIMPEGYSGISEGDTRLGEQDQARRRRGSAEGLGASRESGRGRSQDREGLGPVRKRRPSAGGGRGRAGAGGASHPRGQDNVERPQADEAAMSAEGREQPAVESAAEPPVRASGPVEGAPGEPGGSPGKQPRVSPKAVAEAPDTTTPKQQTEDPTKLDTSGGKDPAAARTGEAAVEPAAEKAEKPEKPKAEKKPAAEKPKRAPRKKKADDS